MNSITYSPIKVYTVNGATVEQYEPDLENSAWQTFKLLTPGADWEHPGDEMIGRLFTAWLKTLPHYNPSFTAYANPCAVVFSRRATGPFLRLARQFQRDWFSQLNDLFFGAERVRRAMNQLDRVARQLAFTGVMIVNGHHVFPHQWPDKASTAESRQIEPRIKQGDRFGALVIGEPLSRGQVRCQCDCGNVVVKYRRHLLSGRTKSCGCLKAKLEERLRNRRRDRGWKLTGEITS